MIGIYDALTPSAILFVFALLTVPVLRIVHKHKKSARACYYTAQKRLRVPPKNLTHN